MCRHHILGWCERNGVGYVVGLAKNSRLEALSQKTMNKAKKQFKKKKRKVRLFCQFQYQAHTWKRQSRVIGRIEHTELGKNPRFVVTNLIDGKRRVYEDRYCQRGDAENRIKEQKLALFADPDGESAIYQQARCLNERRIGRARYRLSSAFTMASIFRLVAVRLATS